MAKLLQKMRRVVIHAFPAKAPRAIVLADVVGREVATFVDQEMDAGGDRDDGLLDRLAAPHSSLHAPDIALVHLHNAAQLVAIRSEKLSQP